MINVTKPTKRNRCEQKEHERQGSCLIWLIENVLFYNDPLYFFCANFGWIYFGDTNATIAQSCGLLFFYLMILNLLSSLGVCLLRTFKRIWYICRLLLFYFFELWLMFYSLLIIFEASLSQRLLYHFTSYCSVSERLWSLSFCYVLDRVTFLSFLWYMECCKHFLVYYM